MGEMKPGHFGHFGQRQPLSTPSITDISDGRTPPYQGVRMSGCPGVRSASRRWLHDFGLTTGGTLCTLLDLVSGAARRCSTQPDTTLRHRKRAGWRDPRRNGSNCARWDANARSARAREPIGLRSRSIRLFGLPRLRPPPPALGSSRHSTYAGGISAGSRQRQNCEPGSHPEQVRSSHGRTTLVRTAPERCRPACSA